MVGPQTPLTSVIGSTAAPLTKARGIKTVGDLLDFWPRRYRPYESDLADLHEGEYAVVVADVRSARLVPMKARRGNRLEVIVTDGQTELELAFFKAWGHESKLRPGVRAVFAGQVSRYGRRLQLAHPDYEVIDRDTEVDLGLLPIYTRVPKLQNWTTMRAVEAVLAARPDLPDPIPEPVREARSLPGRLDATALVHQPRTFADVERGRRRLRYEEAFVLQAELARRRAEQEGVVTTPRAGRTGGLLEAFDARMPFTLTDGQVAVSADIFADLASTTPMNRLLQGEVGSGKTLVALRAMLAVVDSGGQAALLAPTEVLAQQHHRTITSLLGDLAEGGRLGGHDAATRVALLTGSQGAATRQRELLDVVTGEAGIVVGTHALLEGTVKFHDLALVVVDEQHRFGVEQRDALRAKGQSPPHVLVMTATPIPRTVAMTVFGDMETSTLRELPRGRSPIATHVVPVDKPGWLDRVWVRIAEEARGGRQAYVVCPRIHDDDTGGADGVELVEEPLAASVDGELWDAVDANSRPRPPLAAVLRVADDLQANPALAELRLGVLHGQLPAEEKDAVMSAFARGEIDVLVATTVIEVGVDVPNATVMVVLDADRFGVSQLHQLRGRVGRGAHPGLCLLVTGSDAETAQERLTAVAATTDGFELARLDLAQRREGDILGARQSGGRGGLRFLSLLRDEDLVIAAREDAFALVEGDPDLSGHPELAHAVAARLDEAQAAFLERG